jgi:subtilisin family serine protease
MSLPVLRHALVVALYLSLVSAAVLTMASEAAWAQDDDGGDDDDGDDDDDDDDDDRGRGGSGGRDEGQPARPARASGAAPSARAPAVPLPAFAPDEIVTLALNDADLAVLLARGYVVAEERPVPQIGVVARRLLIPPGITLEAAREEVRALSSGADADFNHYYRSEQAQEAGTCEGPHCPFFEQVGWIAPPGATAACAADVTIGLIDTGINPDHTAFAGARIDVHRIASEGLDASRAIHGTAVLALLVGAPDSRSPGLVPDARVIAVDAFHRASGDERADVFALAAAMDYLADRGARIVNMSLAGPPNTVLEQGVQALVARDITIVAATGNAGPRSAPAYPGAYPGVLAVTAVDRNGTVYRRAGQGPHVSLAAPGVEVWTAASVSGARPKTGTSFATPFVTAAAAAILAKDPTLLRDELAARLTATARDLGDAGFDEVYGHGLVQAGQACRR